MSGIDIEGAIVAAANKPAGGVRISEAIAGFLGQKELFDNSGLLDNPDRLAHFFGQTGHESGGFTRRRESLNYSSAKRIKQIFGQGRAGRARFPTLESCEPYVRQKMRLANYVYQNRLGNGDVASGDGWKYRSGGWIMLTGRENYRKFGKLTGLDLEKWPELAATAKGAWKIAIAYFTTQTLGGKTAMDWADERDFYHVTKVINGGTHGLDDRVARTRAALTRLRETWPQPEGN